MSVVADIAAPRVASSKQRQDSARDSISGIASGGQEHEHR
jgi:hypothetical protein